MATQPIRCFTCGKVLEWEKYFCSIRENDNLDEVLDKLRYRRECCRRMFLSYNPQIDEDLSMYPTQASYERKLEF